MNPKQTLELIEEIFNKFNVKSIGVVLVNNEDLTHKELDKELEENG